MSAEKKKIEQVVVAGKGDTKQAAFSSALSEIQKKVLKESSDVLLRIEPRAVTILSAEEVSYTERFLFFFFPRTRTHYQVELKVEVEMTLVEMASVPFKKAQTEDPQGVAIPFLSKKI